LVTVSHYINISLLKTLNQGLGNSQVYDLIQFGFPLNLDKSNFSLATSITDHP
jgi:hypothetical protein